MNTYEGGCSCGAVRYVSQAPTQFVFFANADNASERVARGVPPSS